MKMKLSNEEIQGLVKEAEETLVQKIEELNEQRGDSLMLQELRSVRNAVFFDTYDQLIETIEEKEWSYDSEIIGRFSHWLHQSLESVWLVYVR